MIRVLNKAFDIVELLARRSGNAAALGEIAGELSLHPATCANILKTMASRGYVEQAAPRGGYTVGPMPYALAAQGRYRGDIVAAAEGILERAAAALGETFLLATLHQSRRVILCQAAGQRSIQVRGDLMLLDDAYRTATGRCLLAHLPRAAQDAFVAANGLPPRAVWPRAATPAALRARLDELATLRLVENISPDDDVVQLACPVWHGGRAAGAVGCFVPTYRFKSRHAAAIRAAVCDSAAAIEAALPQLP
jgi:DNA-binding IclR family transcriptional regulator